MGESGCVVGGEGWGRMVGWFGESWTILDVCGRVS